MSPSLIFINSSLLKFNKPNVAASLNRSTETIEDLHFINVIRFISIVGIISIHCLVLPQGLDINRFINSMAYPTVYIAFLNLLRFSLICMCIISGYLIGSKIENQKYHFFVQRLKLILRPFLIALLLTGACLYTCCLVKGTPTSLFILLKQLLLFSSFWFIPSQLISIFILVVAGRHINGAYLGILLLLTLLLLTVGLVYLRPTSHTNYLFSFAFTFYYWLGAYCKEQNIVCRIKKIRLPFILIAWFLSFLLCNYETYVLWQGNYPHILNNLKASNQLYSIISFVAIIRVSSYIAKIPIINPRIDCFGIYLYHWLIVSVMFKLLSRIFALHTISISQSILLSITFSSVVYAVTYAFVKKISNFHFFYLCKEPTKKARLYDILSYSLPAKYRNYKKIA
jgi:hypothetical protein